MLPTEKAANWASYFVVFQENVANCEITMQIPLFGALGTRHAHPVDSLYQKSTSRSLEIRRGFYDVYYSIRYDLYNAVEAASHALSPRPERAELLGATQRLLDRLLFIYYCEDHPQAFIPNETMRNLVAAARRLPGSSPSKVYSFLKELFREIDRGSPVGSGLALPAYNGELFKDHRVIDHIDLPDELTDKTYEVPDPDGGKRVVSGVWGLHVFDFWKDLNEHLLGQIFEESLSDLVALGATPPVPLAQKLRERKQSGVFYTTPILSDFIARHCIQAVLADAAAGAADVTAARTGALLDLHVLDLACGSGAFLVSAYQELATEYWKLREAARVVAGSDRRQLELERYREELDQATLLRSCLYGIDLSPQAVEIAKLALWLRSARKGEKVAELSNNLRAGDSLNVDWLQSALGATVGRFDVVVGNPPWGGLVDPSSQEGARQWLGLRAQDWDSWELFLALSLRMLREGGRLGLVLPDSLFYEAKDGIREILFRAAKIERVFNLGPDWFGKNVRMGAVLLIARKGTYGQDDSCTGVLLSGKYREDAIGGHVPLSQIEAQRSRDVPLARSTHQNGFRIEVFRSLTDDRILDVMERGVKLGDVCERWRGEEINKAGLLWECPGCLKVQVPGRKTKGGGYESKECACGVTIHDGCGTRSLVSESRTSHSVPFIDGDDINRRYVSVEPARWMREDVDGWAYKDAGIYQPPKLLIRQSGVGLLAVLDETRARCPQSVYIYRLKPEFARQGYSHEMLLGVLLSRTMAFYVFKRFGEVEPAKAFAKVTHERLAGLPLPRIDLADRASTREAEQLVEAVDALRRKGPRALGGKEDLAIEGAIRRMWGFSPDDGVYINGEFADLPEGQVIKDLFPHGVPSARRPL